MVRVLLPFLLGVWMVGASMVLAAPTETDDLRNTIPSAQPEPSAQSDAVHAPGTVIVPGGTPNSVQVLPDATTLVIPDTDVLPDTNTVPKTIVPKTIVPDTTARQEILVPETSPRPVGKNTPVPAHNATQSAPLVPKQLHSTPEQKQVEPEQKLVTPQQKVVEPVQKNVTPPVLPKVLSPADFLVKTPEQKAVSPAKEPEHKTPGKESKKEPQKEPKKPVPPVQTPPGEEPKKPEPSAKTPPAKNTPLMIPDEAKKTGKVDFLQGCWKGTRPEYNTKRIITERFCFDDKGVGKRTINDPTGGLVCVGPTLANMRADGALHISSEQALCLSGEEWGAAEMLCVGEGNSTPCSWAFPDVNKSDAHQSYKIRFVRD